MVSIHFVDTYPNDLAKVKGVVSFHFVDTYPNDLAKVKGVISIHFVDTYPIDLAKVKGVISIHFVDTYPNDLVKVKDVVSFHLVDTYLMFSAMFTRMVWTRIQNPEKMEPKRKFLNRVISRVLQYQGRGVFIEHPEITSDTPCLYDRRLWHWFRDAGYSRSFEN